MKQISSEVKDGKIVIYLEKKFYDKEAVSAVSDMLMARYSYAIEPMSGKTVGIHIYPRVGAAMADHELSEIAVSLCSEISRRQSRLHV